MLLQQEQAPLNNHEVLELSKITESWANPSTNTHPIATNGNA